MTHPSAAGPIRAGELTVYDAAPATHSPTPTQPIRSGVLTTYGADPDLAAVVAAWARLPEPIKAGIVAMIRSVGAPPQ